MDWKKKRCLLDGRKGKQRPGKIENAQENSLARARKVLQHGIDNFVETSAKKERFVAAARNLEEERKSKKTNETPQGTLPGGGRTGSLWLCYVGPLAGRQKNGIFGSRQRPKTTSRERNGWGS